MLAIGNPFGLDQTLTTGVISGLGREIKSVTQRSIFDVIQTDASINPGNSGGPLLDSSGRLIGINTAIYSPSGANAGIGFAVPVDTVNAIVPQLLKYGKLTRPGLGINILSDQIAVAADRSTASSILRRRAGRRGRPGRASPGTQAGAAAAWMLGDVIVEARQHRRPPLQRPVPGARCAQGGRRGRCDVIENQGKRRTVKVTLQAIP